MVSDDALATVAIEAITAAQASEIAERGTASLADAPQLAGAMGHFFASALRSAPAVAASPPTGHYVVQLSAAGQAALDSGTVRFLRRVDGRLQSTLVNQAGRFQEHATLVGQVGQRLATAAAVANVAALLIVQAHLVSMERSLARIEKKLDDLHERLDDADLARVRGRLRALQKLRDELSGDATDYDRIRWGVALDQADAEFCQIEELAILRCERAARSIRDARLSVGLVIPSGKALAAAFQRCVDDYQRSLDLRTLCLVGRIAGAHVRRAIGARVAIDELRGDLDTVAADAVAHERLVADKAMEFTTKFPTSKFETATRRSLRDGASAFQTRSAEQTQLLRRHVELLRAEVQVEVRALVEVGPDGHIVALQVFEDPAT